MKLIDHVLKIRGLIQQAIDNRFSRLGLKEEAMPVETLSDEQQPKRRVLDTIIATHQAAMLERRLSRNVSLHSSTDWRL